MTITTRWRDGVGVLWVEQIRSEFRATEDVGEKLLLLHELLKRTWGKSELRGRTQDSDRSGVMDQRTARGMRLLVYMKGSHMTQKQKPKRGFGAMSAEKQKEIASKGGVAAHKKGTAHVFTSEQAKAAGSKGGRAIQSIRRATQEAGQARCALCHEVSCDHSWAERIGTAKAPCVIYPESKTESNSESNSESKTESRTESKTDAREAGTSWMIGNAVIAGNDPETCNHIYPRTRAGNCQGCGSLDGQYPGGTL